MYDHHFSYASVSFALPSRLFLSLLAAEKFVLSDPLVLDSLLDIRCRSLCLVVQREVTMIRMKELKKRNFKLMNETL